MKRLTAAIGRTTFAPWTGRRRTPLTWAVALCWVQGLYFLITGVWPLLSIGTFQAVTGPKTDLWLVRTVGALLAVVGLALLAAGWRRVVAFEVGLLAVLCSAALAAVDVVYVSDGLLSPVYLLDAAAEGLLLAGWGVAATEAVAEKGTERN